MANIFNNLMRGGKSVPRGNRPKEQPSKQAASFFSTLKKPREKLASAENKIEELKKQIAELQKAHTTLSEQHAEMEREFDRALNVLIQHGLLGDTRFFCMSCLDMIRPTKDVTALGTILKCPTCNRSTVTHISTLKPVQLKKDLTLLSRNMAVVQKKFASANEELKKTKESLQFYIDHGFVQKPEEMEARQTGRARRSIR